MSTTSRSSFTFDGDARRQIWTGGGIGIGRRTGKPGRPQQELNLSSEQRRQIREIYGASNLVTMRQLGERVNADPETVARWLEREGLRKRPPRDRGAFGRELALKMVPEGCIESTALRERLCVHKSTMLKRLAAAGQQRVVVRRGRSAGQGDAAMSTADVARLRAPTLVRTAVASEAA